MLKKAYDKEVKNFTDASENKKGPMPDVIVISKQGTQRESLDVVMRTLQGNTINGNDANGNPAVEIGEIAFIDNLNEALERIRLSEPSLIILDTSEEDGHMEKELEQIKVQFPRVKLLVLADIVPWQIYKKMTGLDGLLLKGFSSMQLMKLISKLLNQNPSPHTVEPDGNASQPITDMHKGNY